MICVEKKEMCVTISKVALIKLATRSERQQQRVSKAILQFLV